MSTWQVVPGTTATFIYRWGSPPMTYVDVTVSRLTPLQLTATAHGIPDGWSVAVPDLAALTCLQASSWPPTSCDYRQIRVVDADTVEFNDFDANRENALALNSEGSIAYQTPNDLAGMTGTFSYVDSTNITVVVSVTVDNTAKTLVVTLDASDTTAFVVGTSMSFTLLLTASDSTVVQLDAGTLEVVDGSGC